MSEFVEAQVRAYDERLAEIERRLRDVEDLVRERERLTAARRALVGDRRASDVASGRPRPPEPSAPARPRARRGENREKVLAIVHERPAVTPAELAAATGITQNVVYTTLRTLQRRGEIERVPLPGQRSGYRAASRPNMADAASHDAGTPA